MGTRSEAAWENRPRDEKDNPWTGGHVGQAYASDAMENFLHDSLDIAKRTVKDEVTGGADGATRKYRAGR